MWLAGRRRKTTVKNMSTRLRLLGLVIAALVAAVGVSAWVGGGAWVAGREAQERQAFEGTRHMASRIETELSQLAAMAQVLAASPLLDRAPLPSESERAAFDRMARRATAGTRLAVQLVAADGVWLDTGQTPQHPLPRPGATALAARPAMALLRSADGGVAYVARSEPVQRGAGAVQLHLRVLLPVARLQAVLDGTPVPPGSRHWLLDAQGEPVLRYAAGGGFSPDSALPGPIHQRVAGGGDGRLALQGTQGEPLRGYVSRLPLGWAYAQVQPRAGLDAALAQGVVLPTIAAVSLLALALGTALWLARAEWRRRLAEALQRARRREPWDARRERAAALGRLSARVAHEFNNLLGVISNSAHLIQRHADSPALGMPVAATLRAVDSANRLTQPLLRWGGGLHPQVCTVALDQWLPALRELLVVVLGKRIALDIQVPEAALYTRVDLDGLELAVVNLALDACEALPEGGCVRIVAGLAPGRLLTGLPAGPYVFTSVRKDGPGLDESQARRAFGACSSSRDGEPTAGLGLGQAQDLCVQAGGHTLIESRPGKGAEVFLVLPAVAPQSAAPVPCAGCSSAPVASDWLAPIASRCWTSPARRKL